MMVVVVMGAVVVAADAAIVSWGFGIVLVFSCVQTVFLLVVPTGMPSKHKCKEYVNKNREIWSF